MREVESVDPRRVFRHGTRSIRIVQQLHAARTQHKRINDARVVRHKDRLPNLVALIAPHALHGRIVRTGKRFALGVIVRMAQGDCVEFAYRGSDADADAPVAERMSIFQPRQMIDCRDL